MAKYYVYRGHITSDNCDSYPQWELIECDTMEKVLALHSSWIDPEEIGHDDCDHCCFKVIKGEELKPKPVTQVTKWCFE